MKYGFGIDVGGTTVKFGLFKENGELTNKWEIKTRKENNGEYILGDIAQEVKKTLEKNNISPDNVQGIGIGVPGPVNKDGVVFKCVNLGWGVFNVAETLSGLTGFKVKVANDANIAALGEMWKGSGQGYDNLVMVTLGTGIGGGVIVDGKILNGSHGAGGEIGHIQVELNEKEDCNCGGHGCIEQYASATGIVKMAKDLLKQTEEESPLRTEENISAKIIFDLAKQEDKLAKDLVDNLGSKLSKALSAVSSVCDPDIYLIGGGVSKAGTIILDAIQKYFVNDVFHACKETKFSLAMLGNDAGIYGGMKLVLES